MADDVKEGIKIEVSKKIKEFMTKNRYIDKLIEKKIISSSFPNYNQDDYYLDNDYLQINILHFTKEKKMYTIAIKWELEIVIHRKDREIKMHDYKSDTFINGCFDTTVKLTYDEEDRTPIIDVSEISNLGDGII